MAAAAAAAWRAGSGDGKLRRRLLLLLWLPLLLWETGAEQMEEYLKREHSLTMPYQGAASLSPLGDYIGVTCSVEIRPVKPLPKTGCFPPWRGSTCCISAC